jgi:hypothetical protein
LMPGLNVIGRNLRNAVVLLDAQVADRHVELFIDEHSFTMRALADGVVVDGFPLRKGEEREPMSGRAGASVELPGCHILLGNVGSKAAPSYAEVERQVADGVLTYPPSRASLDSMLQRPRIRRSTAGARWFSGMALLALLAGAWGMWSAWGRAPLADALTPSGLSASAQDPRLALSRALQEWQRLHADVASVQWVAQPNQAPELQGYVHERAALDQLLSAPALQQAQPVVKVAVLGELRQRVTEFLGDPGLRVDTEGAKLVVSGEATRSTTQETLGSLKKELHGRVEIENRVTHALNTRRLKTVRVELPIRIAAVNLAERYIESSKGVRYFVGSPIGQGYEIVSIDSHQLVFSVGGRQVEFPLP